jgi:hypothetical protein
MKVNGPYTVLKLFRQTAVKSSIRHDVPFTRIFPSVSTQEELDSGTRLVAIVYNNTERKSGKNKLPSCI